MSTVPFFSPDGTLGDIPATQAQAALRAGGKPAVQMRAPDGSVGFIPADRMQEAAAKGGTVIPFGSEHQPEQPGKLATAWQDIKAAASAVPSMMGAMVGPTPVPMGGTNVAVSNPGGQFVQQGANIAMADQQRKQQGRGRLYRAGAGVAQLAGANVPGMEAAAAAGNPDAVIGHAVAGAAPYAAALGLGIAGRGQAATPAPTETAAPKPVTPAAPVSTPYRFGLGQIPPEDVAVNPRVLAGGKGIITTRRPPIGALPPGPEPQVTEAPPSNPEFTEPARSAIGGPRQLNPESVTRTILEGFDNKTLVKIAKSRGINITAESQLKPTVGNGRIIGKIVDDMKPEELEEIRDTYIENSRHPLPKGIGPEAYRTAAVSTYFPDINLSNARLLRMGKAMMGATR